MMVKLELLARLVHQVMMVKLVLKVLPAKLDLLDQLDKMVL
jgi:hypothetical protein